MAGWSGSRSSTFPEVRRALILVLALGAACSSGDKNASSTSSTAATSTTSSTTAAATRRIPAFITKVDIKQGVLTYDEIQFLTGDAAKAAYKKDNPCTNTTGCEDAPPNDCYIVNQYKALKTTGIAPNCEVELNILARDNPSSESQGASVVELADAFVKGKFTPDGRDRSEIAASRPFWLTLTAVAVVRIEEQYTP